MSARPKWRTRDEKGGEATLQGINLAREATFNRVVKTPLKLDDSADRLPHGEMLALIVPLQKYPKD